jgi:2-oxoglutarate dehydrogenase E2 component (dihydrolipoamide succinyltransferase)
MNVKAWLSALALVTAMGAAGPSVAQDHMIGGKAVAADQVEAIQAKCDELRSAAAPAATPAPAAPAAPAAAPAAPAAPAATPAPAAADAVDLATLTVAMCDEGGFAAKAP